MRIALATSGDLPELDPDDHPLLEALRGRGHQVTLPVWDGPGTDWRGFDGVLIRSTWDYHHRLGDYLAWAEEVDGATTLLNPLSLVRGFTCKTYLGRLAAEGVPVVPTRFLARGETLDLAALLDSTGWQGAVVKPTVSLDSFGTFRVLPDDLEAGQARLDQASQDRDHMVQPYLDTVDEPGERCLVHLAGKLSHTVRKRSLFRGGRAVGPEGVLVEAAEDERALAAALLARPELAGALYARVDLLRDPQGAPRLLELEVVEPTLFFLEAPDFATRFAAALEARLVSAGCDPAPA